MPPSASGSAERAGCRGRCGDEERLGHGRPLGGARRPAALRRYSREQELEADRVGVGYITRAGYRGDAMATLIEKLRRQAQLEDCSSWASAETSVDRRSAMSTHPAADERLAALRRHGRRARAPGESGRAAYLDGDRRHVGRRSAARKASCAANASCIPCCKLAFAAPRDFRLFNDHDGVLGVGTRPLAAVFLLHRAGRCRASSTTGCATS